MPLTWPDTARRLNFKLIVLPYLRLPTSPAESTATMNPLDPNHTYPHHLAPTAAYGFLISVDECVGITVGHAP